MNTVAMMKQVLPLLAAMLLAASCGERGKHDEARLDAAGREYFEAIKDEHGWLGPVALHREALRETTTAGKSELASLDYQHALAKLEEARAKVAKLKSQLMGIAPEDAPIWAKLDDYEELLRKTAQEEAVARRLAAEEPPRDEAFEARRAATEARQAAWDMTWDELKAGSVP